MNNKPVEIQDFLGLRDRTFLVTGVANRKSVAAFVTKGLLAQGARVILSVQNDANAGKAAKLFPELPIFTCDVSDENALACLADQVGEASGGRIHGLVHSIAFANYSDGMKPFHEVNRSDFLQAADISCFSLLALSRHMKPILDPQGSVVTISISTTRMAAENYGYMGPIKAALDSAVCFLAKSFSRFSQVRFNSVNPGLLKTSASAGIPGYIDSYLFAENITLRKKAVMTEEVANAVLFLLSPRSSGINAQGMVIDAGMSINYFEACEDPAD